MIDREKVIITCAITGAIHTPCMSPYLPITPEEIAREAIAAAEPGAAHPPYPGGIVVGNRHPGRGA